MRSGPDDSIGVRAIINLTPDGYLPQEVETPELEHVNKAVDAGLEEYGSLFLQELDQHGARGAVRFLEDLEAQRKNALDKVQVIYRKAAHHNSGALEDYRHVANGLVAIRAASTIALAALSLPVVGTVAAGSAWAAFGVGLSYSAGLSIIKKWERAGSADMVMIVGGKAVDKGASKATKSATKGMAGILSQESENAMLSAEQKIRWLEKRVAEGGGGRDIRRLARAKEALEAAKRTGDIARLLRTVPYLFFAWSATSAISEAYEEWQ